MEAGGLGGAGRDLGRGTFRARRAASRSTAKTAGKCEGIRGQISGFP
jgi:hypothetical protein